MKLLRSMIAVLLALWPTLAVAQTVSTFLSFPRERPVLGIAIDNDDNLYATQGFDILKISPDRNVQVFTRGLPVHTPRNLHRIAIDRNGYIYVGCVECSEIFQVSPAGRMNILCSGSCDGDVRFAVDSVGGLYISQAGAIVKLDPSNPSSDFPAQPPCDQMNMVLMRACSAISIFASVGKENCVVDFTFDRVGNFYLATCTGTYKFTPQGANSKVTSLSGPIAIDGSGSLYVVQPRNTIAKVTPSGNVEKFVVAVPGVADLSPNSLGDVVIDSKGNLFVLNTDANDQVSIIKASAFSP